MSEGTTEKQRKELLRDLIAQNVGLLAEIDRLRAEVKKAEDAACDFANGGHAFLSDLPALGMWECPGSGLWYTRREDRCECCEEPTMRGDHWKHGEE